MLAGIEGQVGGRFERDRVGVDEEDRDDAPPVVLVVTGRAALDYGPFRRWGMDVLTEGSGNTLMVLSSSEAREVFADLVDEYGGDRADWTKPEAWRKQLDAIESVRLYDARDRADGQLEDLNFESLEVVDVLLWASMAERSSRRAEAARRRVHEVEEFVASAAELDDRVAVLAVDDRPDTTMMRVAVTRELLDGLLANAWVERVRPPVQPVLTSDHLLEAPVPPPWERPPATGAPIGVIDDLVMDNTLLQDVVAGRASFPDGYVFNPPSDHGTHVAAVAAYGELRTHIVDGAPLPAPHPIYGARVMEASALRLGRTQVVGYLHEQLERALKWLHAEGVKVAVCSINQLVPDDSLVPSPEVLVIDRLARELDMVVVLSTGNVASVSPHHWQTDYPTYLHRPEARVADPGTAALGVTVSAVAHHDVPGAVNRQHQVPIAHAGQPSPFTRVGPTRGRTKTLTQKPEFEAHGGNFSWDHQNSSVHPNDPAMGVITLSTPRNNNPVFTAVTGTSFAAPYVAHQIADIATRYPRASANLLRALTALSGRVNPASRNHGLPIVVSAFGEPNAHSVLESGPDRVVLVFEGAIPVGGVSVQRIPVPADFATGARNQTMRVALAYDPPVRRDRGGYAAGDMSFDVTRAMTEAEVVQLYELQPSEEEVSADPSKVRLPLPHDRRRPNLQPGVKTFASNTLMRRTLDWDWNPDDEDYFLVLRHTPRRWSKTANDPTEQSYALAIELSMQATASVDLFSLVRAQIEARARVRVRS
ncbi:MAG: hypothetical protein BGO37_12965 [Cellulomonas sp. 73-92]|nr:MAG: hypothetical protein BGO37_12965 [Cellulomonas sp. 73-92]